MKTHLIITALSLSSAMAQFSWDKEPLVDPVQAAVDRIDNAVRTPVITQIKPIESLLQPIVSPVVDVDPLVEQCDLEPDVAQAYRSAVLSDSTRHPQPVTSYGRDAACPKYLGRLSANPYESDSTANPYSPAGSPYFSTSINNRFGPYGSPYASTSARNPYATDAPKIIAQDGTYLGKLSDNRYDPDSVSNPYGRYGSPYSPTSINNPYSNYGSKYSSQSPNNPYATQAPLLFGE
jgi:hypothetical protein